MSTQNPILNTLGKKKNKNSECIRKWVIIPPSTLPNFILRIHYSSELGVEN